MGAIQPWDTSQISNFTDLNPVLQKAGQIDGKQYEIALDWGYSGVILRADMLDPSINSYSYLFDDAGAGHISWFDTPWILQQAAIVLGIEPEPHLRHDTRRARAVQAVLHRPRQEPLQHLDRTTPTCGTT